MVQYISAQSYCAQINDKIGGGVWFAEYQVCQEACAGQSGQAAQNKAAKSALKTELKKFDAAVAEGNRSEADVAYKVAVKAVDKAAAKGLLHKNNAANKKSSMTIKLNKLA